MSASPHIDALAEYLRELRADGAASGTVRTVSLEGAIGEIRELQRDAEELVNLRAMVSRRRRAYSTIEIEDEALVRVIDRESLAMDLRTRLDHKVLGAAANAIEYHTDYLPDRAMTRITATLWTIPPAIPTELSLQPKEIES